MVNIQSAMLVLLGFLVALLLALLVAPAYWRRAVRLTTAGLKQSMPLTEAEIRADKDRLRAEYAIKVHRLEVKGQEADETAARQQIELSRRDAAISSLEGEIGRLKTALEEHENARRVLEQTITDRVPRLEQRLSEARRILAEREQQVATLSETAGRQAKALEEAGQLTAQQRDEVMRLNSSLAAISARTREGLADPKFDAEVALRTEVEALRARLAQQAAQIEQLGSGSVEPAGLRPVAAAVASARVYELDEETVLSRARREMDTVQAVRAELEKELTAVRRTLEDRDTELAGVKAALAAYERGSKEERTATLKDSRLAMKVRIGALQAESQQQSATIQRLRSEVASANERLAKQAAHFMAEMRRLGTGGAAAQARPATEPVRTGTDAAERSQRSPKLAALTRPVASVMARARDAAGGAPAQDASRVSGFLKALGGASVARGGAKSEAGAEATAAEPVEVASTPVPEAPRRLGDRIVRATKS